MTFRTLAVAHLEPDYSVTIIARSARDYVWLLARKPDMSDADYARSSKRWGTR
jgi:apolipoprotein D and lipocalin family protein